MCRLIPGACLFLTRAESLGIDYAKYRGVITSTMPFDHGIRVSGRNEKEDKWFRYYMSGLRKGDFL